jgi:hypothetical protein
MEHVARSNSLTSISSYSPGIKYHPNNFKNMSIKELETNIETDTQVVNFMYTHW